MAEDLEAEMYLATIDRLAAAGFEHYEISSWARPGHRCRHNLLYWRNGSWWPLGPSAAGHAGGVRWRNVPRLGDYLAGAGLPPVTDAERLDPDARAGEALMLALRLAEGVADADVAPRADAIERHTAGGLLERTGGRVRLTRRGLLLADTVLADVL